jgi:hypothetical protein
MPRKRLTEEGVAKLKPPPSGKQVDYYETRLVLRVNYGGAKIWRALYYVNAPATTASKSRSRPLTSSAAIRRSS